jgi:hypothetical protein
MTTYDVYVRLSGLTHFQIEADSQAAAEELAKRMFRDGSSIDARDESDFDEDVHHHFSHVKEMT